MGCSNGRTISIVNKSDKFKVAKIQEFKPIVDDKEDKLLNDDEWWEEIKNQHRKEKEGKRISSNPGWANPFGNAPLLSKDILLGK